MQVLIKVTPQFPVRFPIFWSIADTALLADTLRITSNITNRIDTCTFHTKDADIPCESEVIITNMAETTRYFAGYAKSIEPYVIGVTPHYAISCADYTCELDKILVNEAYESGIVAFPAAFPIDWGAVVTDGSVIADLCTKYASDFNGTTYVQAGKTHDKIKFNRITFREVLNQLSRDSGYDWYLDYNKNLHYFSKETNLAPFGISDNPDDSTTYPAYDFKYKKDTSQIINRVLIVGGTYLSDDTTFDTIPASGAQTEIRLPYIFEPPEGYNMIRVDHNVGTDAVPQWAADIVGIDGIDTNGTKGVTVLFNRDEKTLIFNTAPLELDKSVRVRGRYHAKLRTRVRSDTSYTRFGRWYDSKIVNTNINDRKWARLEGKAILAKYALPRESGSFKCTTDGLSSGEQINIVNTLREINGDYLIHKIITRILGGTQMEYTISFGEYNPDLIDMVIAAKARQDFEPTHEDELLSEVLERMETLQLSETTAYYTDTWDGEVSRWIALPPSQSVGHHVEHERVTLSEATTATKRVTEKYAWQ